MSFWWILSVSSHALHTQTSLVTGLFHILISKHSAFCSHDYKLPLLPRSSPQEFSTLHFSNASSCPSCAKTSPWHSVVKERPHLSRQPLPHPNPAPGKLSSMPGVQMVACLWLEKWYFIKYSSTYFDKIWGNVKKRVCDQYLFYQEAGI